MKILGMKKVGAYCQQAFQKIHPLFCYVFLQQQPCGYDLSGTHSIYHTKVEFLVPCKTGAENQIRDVWYISSISYNHPICVHQ